MKKRFYCESIEALDGIAGELLALFPEQRVFAFYGKLGAGKTTLIKKICKQLQVTDEVTSPTFSLINQYITRKGEPVYHFDFYRINKTEEVFDIGYEEFLYSGDYCFIEWPEKVAELLPENYVYVGINETGREGSREIELSLA